MDPQEIFQIALKYREEPPDEEALNCRNLFEQLRSSSEPIPGLIEIFNAYNIEENKLEYYNYQRMILEILNHRIKSYLYDINADLKTHLRSFFLENLDDNPYYVEMEPGTRMDDITKAKNDIMKLISECQAQLSLYELFDPWEIAFEKFLDNHFCYFVIHYFSALAQINFDNLALFQQIRASIEGDIDNKIFSKLYAILNPEEETAKAPGYPAYVYIAISRYIIWGSNSHQIIGDSGFISSVLELKQYPYIIDLLNNAIKRLNLDSLGFISEFIPLDDIFNTAKAQIQHLPETSKYIRSTASFINTIILSMDNNNDFLQGSGMFQNLMDFLSIQDEDTTNFLIPSLTFLIQNVNQDQGIIDSILARISFYFSVKQDLIESDQLVPNLCNAMSKANLEFLGGYLNTLIDDQNFQNDPNFASAILSSLSYIKNIPLNIKFEILGKLGQLYNDELMPNSFPTLYRNYYLILFLSSFNIPYPQENQQMSEENSNILQAIFTIMKDCILPQMNVITNKENISYQYLKPVRKIVSKLRSYGAVFTEMVDALCSELVKLDQFPEEAAKLIAFLIDNDSLESLNKVLDTLNENIQESRNFQVIDFSLNIISNLKYIEIGQISELLANNLLQYYKLISIDFKFDRLIGSLFKAYAMIIPYASSITEETNPINNLQQLIDLINFGDKFAVGCSFHLISAVLSSGQAEQFAGLNDYIQNSTGFLPGVLYSPPNEEDRQVLKEMSKYYSEFLKSYIDVNKENIEDVFNTMAEVLPHQFEIGYKHSIFIEHLIDVLIYLIDSECPASPMTNFLDRSLSFLFNFSFHPSYVGYKKVLINTLRFHGQLIRGAFPEFKEKFEGFLGSLGASARTQEYSEKYYQYFQEPADPNDLLNNNDITIFYNSIISDRNSASWGIPQSAPASQA